MKTNHQRGFKERRSPKRYGGSPLGCIKRTSNFANVSVDAGYGGDNSNGHRGYAKAKRGAKKYVRSRVRFHEKMELRKVTNTEGL